MSSQIHRNVGFSYRISYFNADNVSMRRAEDVLISVSRSYDIQCRKLISLLPKINRRKNEYFIRFQRFRCFLFEI